MRAERSTTCPECVFVYWGQAFWRGLTLYTCTCSFLYRMRQSSIVFSPPIIWIGIQVLDACKKKHNMPGMHVCLLLGTSVLRRGLTLYNVHVRFCFYPNTSKQHRFSPPIVWISRGAYFFDIHFSSEMNLCCDAVAVTYR